MSEYDDSRSIDLEEARQVLRGRGGAPPTIEVIRRWANPNIGCTPQGPDGPRVVLRAVKISGRLRTMPEWVAAFEKERAAASAEARSSGVWPPPRPARSRQAAHRRAEESLDEAGVK